MGGVPRPALLVVQAARVAIEAAVVQLLLHMNAQALLPWGKVMGSTAAHELLSSQLLLLLLLWGQLALELRPCSDAQGRQALSRISAASTSQLYLRHLNLELPSKWPWQLLCSQLTLEMLCARLKGLGDLGQI